MTLTLALLLLAAPGAAGNAAAPADTPVVLIETTQGDIKVELDAKAAPITVANFLDYVSAGHYDGTIFHRVIHDFMIQGGGFDASMKEKPTHRPIKNEHGNGLTNVRGSIAMARTNDPDSATAQFFINLKDNDFLDRAPGYAVFGKVIAGMDIVDRIAGLKTTMRAGMGDVPLLTVTIKRIHKVGAPAAAPASKPAAGQAKPEKSEKAGKDESAPQ